MNKCLSLIKSAHLASVSCFQNRPLSYSITSFIRREHREMAKIVAATKNVALPGEHAGYIDNKRLDGWFPTLETLETEFDGVKYKDLPICTIKLTKNNTKVSFTDSTGIPITYSTAGLEGFKNAKKGTNTAGQTVGIGSSVKAQRKGLKNIRLVLRGLGPGRDSVVKGIAMTGINIVSITDYSRLPELGPRPKKKRRL